MLLHTQFFFFQQLIATESLSPRYKNIHYELCKSSLQPPTCEHQGCIVWHFVNLSKLFNQTHSKKKCLNCQPFVVIVKTRAVQCWSQQEKMDGRHISIG